MNTFPLSRYCPDWQGEMIERVEQPLARGINLLRAASRGQQCLIIELKSVFDYDGLFDTVGSVTAWPDAEAAALAGQQIILEQEGKVLSKGKDWALQSKSAHEWQVLPATGNVVPGKFAKQIIGRRYANGSPYDSVYLRIMLIEREEGSDLVDQLLAHDGYRDALISYLIDLGRERSNA